MSSTPEEAGLWAKIAGGASALVLTLIGVVWGSVKHRLNRHDAHIEKLYSNAENDRALVRDLHDEAMREIRHWQSEILKAIKDR